jgi:hypothetical protein
VPAGSGAGRWLTKVAGKASVPTSVAFAGLEQQLADAEDHNLTRGQRLVRTTTSAAIDGTGAALGGTVGVIAGGVLTGSAVGAAGGAVAGAELGSAAGGGVRRWKPISSASAAAARGLDRLLGTAHDDDYDERLDLETRP